MVFFYGYGSMLRNCHPGYENDERSSLGERPDRRQWREEGGERVAGVGEGRRRSVAKDIRRALQQGRYAEPFLVNVRHNDNKSSPASATMKTTAFAVVFLYFHNFLRRNGTYQNSFDTTFDTNAESK